MIRREPWMPALLTVVTCGVYYFYWQWVTTDELRTATGREDLNPMTDLLLSILCCGFWSVWVQYRNAQVVHQAFQARGQSHEDKSVFILLLHALSALNGVTGLVAIFLLQDEYNKLADSHGGGAMFGGPPRAF